MKDPNRQDGITFNISTIPNFGVRWTDIHYRHWPFVLGFTLITFGIAAAVLPFLCGRTAFFPEITYMAEKIAESQPGISGWPIFFGSALIIAYIYRAVRQWLIRLFGDRIDANITGVEEEDSYAIIGLRPKRILASAMVDGTLRQFRSRAFLSDPSKLIQEQENNVLPLFIKFQNHCLWQ